MSGFFASLAGLNKLSDQVIATDFLITTKSAIKSYAAALAETVTPELREVLKNHLNSAIDTHEAITKYMIDYGYYNAYNPQEQFKIDLQEADKALNAERPV